MYVNKNIKLKKIQIIKIIDLFGKGKGRHVIYEEVSMVAHEDLLMAGVYKSILLILMICFACIYVLFYSNNFLKRKK
jgi:hypothetical protein